MTPGFAAFHFRLQSGEPLVTGLLLGKPQFEKLDLMGHFDPFGLEPPPLGIGLSLRFPLAGREYDTCCRHGSEQAPEAIGQ